MEQPQQHPSTEPLNQQTTTSTTAASCTADAVAFDSVRQAAVVMFQQRTKDLTRLASVEAQSQQVETELQQAQTSVAQLSAQQASLEALVHEEEQRTRQREGCLATLHGALVQLDEEQRASKKLQRAAVAAIGTASAFVAHFTSADGRLFQLLSLAKERTSGRSAQELQSVLSQVQHRIAEAQTHHQSLLCCPSSHLAVEEVDGSEANLSDAASACVLALQTWTRMKGSWGLHRELAPVVELCEQLARWATLEQSDTSNGSTYERPLMTEETEARELPLKPLPPCPAGTVPEAVFFADATPCHDPLACADAETVTSAEDGAALIAAAEPAVAAETWVAEVALSPMRHLSTWYTTLAARCAAHRMQIPPAVADTLAAVEAAPAEWAARLQERSRWDALRTAAHEASALAAAATAERESMQASIQSRQTQCEERIEAHAQRLHEIATGREVELQHYAVAWQKGWNTLRAQHASITALRDAVAMRQSGADYTTALALREAEQHAQVVAVEETTLAEAETRLSAAQAELEAMLAHKAELEMQLSAAQQTEVVVLSHLDALTERLQQHRGETDVSNDNQSAVQTAFHAETCGDVRHVSSVCSLADVVASVSSCSEELKRWAAAVDAETAHDNGARVLMAVIGAVSHDVGQESTACLTEHATVTTDQLCAVLQRAAVTLDLPSELFSAEVVGTELLQSLAGITTSMCTDAQSLRVHEAAHRGFVEAATTEKTALLRELSVLE